MNLKNKISRAINSKKSVPTVLALSVMFVSLLSFQNCSNKLSSSTESLNSLDNNIASSNSLENLSTSEDSIITSDSAAVIIANNPNCPKLEVDRSRFKDFGHGIDSMDENSLLATFNSLFAMTRVNGTKYGRGTVLGIRDLYESKFGKKIQIYPHPSDPSLETDRSRSTGFGYYENMDEATLIAHFNSKRVLARDKYDRGFLAEMRDVYMRKFGKTFEECPFWNGEE